MHKLKSSDDGKAKEARFDPTYLQRVCITFAFTPSTKSTTKFIPLQL